MDYFICFNKYFRHLFTQRHPLTQLGLSLLVDAFFDCGWFTVTWIKRASTQLTPTAQRKKANDEQVHHWFFCVVLRGQPVARRTLP